ncbi:hypothetical protein BGX28_005464 [Mortierella sp. GBA30]|nr:hypothetical protein BGX28_005464 [Mortierella sp. GBA30]
MRLDLATYLTGVEGLKGVDLRQLGSYLAINYLENLFGNLYRMTTADEHVKWVCRDHYRAGYQKAHKQKLRDVVNLAGGEFDKQLERIEMTLTSSFAAWEFCGVISRTNGVFELCVDLDWSSGYDNFVRLKDMISISTIKSIKLKMPLQGPIIDNILLVGRWYEPIFGIMRLPGIQCFVITNHPQDLFTLSNSIPRNVDLSNLRRLESRGLDDRTMSDANYTKVMLLVVQAPNISYLSLGTHLE